MARDLSRNLVQRKRAPGEEGAGRWMNVGTKREECACGAPKRASLTQRPIETERESTHPVRKSSRGREGAVTEELLVSGKVARKPPRERIAEISSIIKVR